MVKRNTKIVPDKNDDKNNLILTSKWRILHECIRESPPQFENQIMPLVYRRSITRSTMYQKAPFC